MRRIAGIAVLCFAGCASQKLSGNSELISITGRVDRSDKAGPWFAWGGTSIKLRFSGTKATVKLREAPSPEFEAHLRYPNKYRFLIDGHTVDDVMAKGGDWSWATPELPRGEHLLEVLKETEGGVGEAQLVGIEVEGAALPPPERPKRRLEFVGDSHTVGYGALGAKPDCPFSSETESHSDAFAARVAEALGAEAHFVAMSGRGVTRNYDDDRPPETVPVLWRRTLPDRAKAAWNPADFQPDAVVVLLGSNDFGPGDPGQSLVDGYVAFLKELRAAYPKAHLLALAKMYPDAFPGYVQQAVDAAKAAGEKNLSMAILPKTAPGDPKGCAGHATPITHQKHAEVVQDALASALSWGWR